MVEKPRFFDGFTRIDELLVENIRTLQEFIYLLQPTEGDGVKIIDAAKKPLVLAYPSSGSTLATLATGDTILDFAAGTITDVNGYVTDMKQSLSERDFEWARSFFIQSDKTISIQIDNNDAIVAQDKKDALGSHQQFKRIKIITYTPTDVLVIISTDPKALIQLVSNTISIDATTPTNAPSSATPDKVSVGNTSTTVMAAKSDRHFAQFVNDSDETIYLSLSATAVMNKGIRLNVEGGAFEINSTNIYIGAVSAICSSGTKNLAITEG